MDVSVLFEQMQTGDESAISKIWSFFAADLAKVARKRLAPNSRRTYDEDDACVSAFRSFCSAVANGKINSRLDRESLLRLLIVFTSRKASQRNRYASRQCRNSNKTASFYEASEEPQPNNSASPAELAVDFLDACDVMFSSLDDPVLQDICWLKMEGYSESEIAARLGKSVRTIQRKTELIRRSWKKIAEKEDALEA